MTAVTDPSNFVSPTRVVELTAQLVGHDTQNPPGQEHTIVQPLTELLTGLGCTVETFEQEAGRPSVLATFEVGVGPEAPTLLINGHLDVVPVIAEEWSHPPFNARVVGDRLYGRGTADMKGGIAAAIEGLCACRDAGVPLPFRLVFHLVSDEETGGERGTKALVDAGLVQADACIVPEPTELAVSVAERGAFQARVRVHGVSGHGSEPAAGRSAIADAARMVDAIHLGHFYAVPHPLLGAPTCNVSLISGGLASNVIAPSCEFVLDRRILPPDAAGEVLHDLRRRFEEACPGAEYQVETIAEVEASEMDPDHPWPMYVSTVASSGSGSRVGLSLATDGRFLRNQLGIPTVIYGPGSIAQAHTTDEWVAVSELVEASRTFARVYAGFGREVAGPRLESA